jgi:hypothetical protein
MKNIEQFIQEEMNRIHAEEVPSEFEILMSYVIYQYFTDYNENNPGKEIYFNTFKEMYEEYWKIQLDDIPSYKRIIQ